MRTRLLNACVLVLFLFPLSMARAQNVKARFQPAIPAPQKLVPTADDQLFLSPDDIPRVQRVLPGLVEASRKGRTESQTFLARQGISFRELTQVLSNISVAYSAITFDEWLKEVQPLLADRAGEYNKLIDEARRQLEEITAKHQRAQKSGRSALTVNKEIVARNKALVEEIIGLLREVNVQSLPQDSTADLPPAQPQ
jgi:hypothetical protein